MSDPIPFRRSGSGATGPAPDVRRVVVVSAGLADPSSTGLLADLLSQATTRAADARGTAVEVVRIDLRALAHGLTDALLTGFASGDVAEAQAQVAAADAVVAVTPVFSASYNGLFKTFFDVLEQGALDGVSVLVGATAGTARHSLVLDHALRPLFAYLRAVVLPTGVFAASEDWAGEGAGGTAGRTGGSALRSRIDRAAGELVDHLAGPRPRAERLDQFDRDVAAMGSFEDLLGG